VSFLPFIPIKYPEGAAAPTTPASKLLVVSSSLCVGSTSVQYQISSCRPMENQTVYFSTTSSRISWNCFLRPRRSSQDPVAGCLARSSMTTSPVQRRNVTVDHPSSGDSCILPWLCTVVGPRHLTTRRLSTDAISCTDHVPVRRSSRVLRERRYVLWLRPSFRLGQSPRFLPGSLRDLLLTHGLHLYWVALTATSISASSSLEFVRKT
jgi:hypothetical protein